MSNAEHGCRLVSLFLAFAFAVVGGSVGLNALIKSNQDQTRIRNSVPGATVYINVNDIYQTGVVATTVCALIALLTLIYFIHSLARPARWWTQVQAWTLAFCATWLFAVMVAYDVFIRNRSAQVSVYVGGVLVPQRAIPGVRLGSTTYRHIYYLRLAAVLPWMTILFTAVAVCALAMCLEEDRATRAAPKSSEAAGAATVEKEPPVEPARSV